MYSPIYLPLNAIIISFPFRFTLTFSTTLPTSDFAKTVITFSLISKRITLNLSFLATIDALSILVKSAFLFTVTVFSKVVGRI